MHHKRLHKADLPGLIDEWVAQATVYAPLSRNGYAEFQPVGEGAQVDLDYAANTRYPPKSLFLSQSETMFRLRRGELRSAVAPTSPQVVLGIRPCDARAVQLLDGVFMDELHPDPYWVEKVHAVISLKKGTSATPVLTIFPDNDTSFVPLLRSVPVEVYHSEPLLIIKGTLAQVSTLFRTLGFSQIPFTEV